MAGETVPDVARDVETADAAVTVGCSLVVGLYAGWIAADLLPRWLAFVLVAVGTGYVLLDVPDQRTRVGTAAYILAGLLALTPVALVVPDAAAAGALGVGPLSMVLTTANAIVTVIFLAVAGGVAYLGHRLGGHRPRPLRR